VVVLVLSYPGGPALLTIRAVQRLIGTAVGIGAFALLLEANLGETASVLLLAVLLLAISGITARNYLYGSILITVLALYMTVPMTTGQSPSDLAANRLVDTLAAVIISLLMIRAIGPRLAPALVMVSVRRIARAAVLVVDQVLAGRPLADPAFVERRRRLQYGLLRAGRDARLAAASPGGPEAELERRAARLGYLILGASWLRGSEGGRERLSALRGRLERVARMNRDDIAALRRDIDRASADLEAAREA
ncbi:MAG TPA: FUSC family protein, partial [Mycobacteriales bacterium]|nr:FUSC family protein [Mycobacteriales bacterium]